MGFRRFCSVLDTESHEHLKLTPVPISEYWQIGAQQGESSTMKKLIVISLLIVVSLLAVFNAFAQEQTVVIQNVVECPVTTIGWWGLTGELINDAPTRDVIVHWDDTNQRSAKELGVDPEQGWIVWCTESDMLSRVATVEGEPNRITIDGDEYCQVAGFVTNLPDRRVVGVTAAAAYAFTECLGETIVESSYVRTFGIVFD